MGLWGIALETSDSSKLNEHLTIGLEYMKDREGIDVTGEGGFKIKYKYTAPEQEPFFEIVDYIHAHPDIFFNYSEFGGHKRLPLGATDFHQENLWLQLYKEDSGFEMYTIVKWPDMGNGPIPEVEHVIAMIKDTYMEELLKHPWEGSLFGLDEEEADITEPRRIY